MFLRLTATLGLLLAALVPAAAAPKARKSGGKVQTPPPNHPPLIAAPLNQLPEGVERIDVILLLGQSNMKGRGIMPEEPLNDPRLLAMHLKDDAWYRARHPLHLTGDPQTFAGHDNAGVGPGLACAQTLLAASPGTRIALVPCAVGGTALKRWEKGADLYENAVRRALKTLKDAGDVPVRLRAALWLQGEADAKPGQVETYAARLAQMIADLRADLKAPQLPFVASAIGEMRPGGLQPQINAQLLALSQNVPAAGCADARDLKSSIGDNVHFDTASQEEIGRRMAAEVQRIEAASKP